MKAFVRKNGILYKAYREGMDWRIVIVDKKQTCERWFSVWASDVEGSMFNALQKASGCTFNEIERVTE